MNKLFEQIFSRPDHLFFDYDKQKYQITNEAPMDDDLSALKMRRVCQQYESQFNAFRHGYLAGSKNPLASEQV